MWKRTERLNADPYLKAASAITSAAITASAGAGNGAAAPAADATATTAATEAEQSKSEGVEMDAAGNTPQHIAAIKKDSGNDTLEQGTLEPAAAHGDEAPVAAAITTSTVIPSTGSVKETNVAAPPAQDDRGTTLDATGRPGEKKTLAGVAGRKKRLNQTVPKATREALRGIKKNFHASLGHYGKMLRKIKTARRGSNMSSTADKPVDEANGDDIHADEGDVKDKDKSNAAEEGNGKGKAIV